MKQITVEYFIMTYTSKINSITFRYNIGSKTVVVALNLKVWDLLLALINNIICLANKNFDFIIRNAKHLREVSTMSIVYNAFVRSKFVYAVII